MTKGGIEPAKAVVSERHNRFITSADTGVCCFRSTTREKRKPPTVSTEWSADSGSAAVRFCILPWFNAPLQTERYEDPLGYFRPSSPKGTG
jgi:hypothetical protein